jgi:hypothetical protein
MKIYIVNHGWATKYIWLGVVEEVYVGFDFVKHIKEYNMTFTVYKGTTEADCHGSSTALQFYSREVLDVLREFAGDRIVGIKIETDTKIKRDYFYLEIKSSLPRIQCRDIFKEPDISEYCRKNNVARGNIMIVGSDIAPVYADFSEWDGSHVFTLENSSIHFITEELKKALHKKKFKNLKYEEVMFLEEVA